MRFLFIFLLTTQIATAQVVCYVVPAPYKVVNASAIGQTFTACISAESITIRTNLAVYPFQNSAIIFQVKNANGTVIGSTLYTGNLMVYDYVTHPPLPEVSVNILCDLLAGQQYMWEVVQCCETFGGTQNGVDIPVYIVMQQSNNDVTNGGVTFTFISPNGTNQTESSTQYDIRSSVIAYETVGCIGDCDGSGYIDIPDSYCLVSEFGLTCDDVDVLYMDFDQDCDVDEEDVEIFKQNFGMPCDF